MNEQYTSLSLFYDAFMQDVDYGAWCDFYEEAFRRFSTKNVENLFFLYQNEQKKMTPEGVIFLLIFND